MAQGVVQGGLAPGLVAHQDVDEGDAGDGGHVIEQADLAGGGQPAQLQREEHHYQQRQPEHRHRITDEAGGHDGEIERLALGEGRQGAERDAHQQRDGEGRPAEDQGGGEVVTDLVQHRQAGDAGEPQIPVQNAAQEVGVAAPEAGLLADEAHVQQVGDEGQRQQGDEQQIDATQDIEKHAYSR